MRVGFIGLGQMGRPIAQRIIGNGLPLKVFDISKTASQGFNDIANNFSDFQKCKYILTMLPNDQSLKRVCIGEESLLDKMEPGASIFDLSTTSLSVFKEIDTALKTKNIKIIDCPVSGGNLK